jgi:XrtJ-associated TM-motif-TM protein
MIRRSAILFALFFGAALMHLHAQSGCVDSPESPTLVLALIGSIGLVAGTLRSARGNRQ